MTKYDRSDLRSLESVRFHHDRLTTDFRQFVEQRIFPRVGFTGYKLDQQQELAMQMLLCLISTGLLDMVVADSRDTGQVGGQMRVKVWDALLKAGFCLSCPGSEQSGMVTRYSATNKLLDLKRNWDLKLLVDTSLERNTELDEPTKYALVVLQGSSKICHLTGRWIVDDDDNRVYPIHNAVANSAQPGLDGKPDPKAVQNGMEYFAAVESIIERINSTNFDYGWKCYTDDRQRSFQVNPGLRQVHCGALGRAVRLYGWGDMSGQRLSKKQRARITIDGEPGAELDFSCFHTRMLYHFKGIDPPGDAYKPELIFPKFHSFKNARKSQRAAIRNFVKWATCACWNTASRGEANSAAGNLLHGDQSKLKQDQPFVRRIVKDVEESSPKDMIRRIMDAHPALADQFFSECGIHLMTTDGKMMLHILSAITDAGLPALGIHDSVLCRASDAYLVEREMRKAYRKFTKFSPVIERSF